MVWIAVAVGIVVLLVFAAGSKGHRSKSKMDLNRRGGGKILDDYDAEQSFVDKYSK